VAGLSDLVMFHGRHDHEFIAHSHDVVTAILVTAGAVEIDIDGTGHRVGAGQLVVIGAHQVHAARPIDAHGWAMRSLHLPLGLLAEGDGSHGNARGAVSFAEPVDRSVGPAASSFRELHGCSEREEREPQQADLGRSLVHWFLENIAAFGPQAPWRDPVDVRLERARHILAGALFENMLLARVAEEVGLSVYSLIRHFKEGYGFSPHAWRMQARASAAAKLLRSNESLAHVAGSCGFADQPHLTRVFKRVYGVTPGQYSLMH
jgi:AraC-like DNA-binding protein